MNEFCLIGYSGHSFVVYETLESNGIKTKFYCDLFKKSFNPYGLEYIGDEKSAVENNLFLNLSPVLAIGDNNLRMKVGEFLSNNNIKLSSAFHKDSHISKTASVGGGTVIFSGTRIGPQVKIGSGVICNTNCTVEHEVKIGDYSHICPGAVVTGNVKIGERVLVGANTVILPGVVVGDDAIIGAGSVVVNDVEPNKIVFGNPAKSKKL